MSLPGLIFWLLVAHAVADFSLQIDAMAKGKNRHNKTTPPPGAKFVPCWPYWLSAHALIHGGAVAMVLDWRFGIAETIAHWLIDFGKCENRYGVHYDQLMHMCCKVIWLTLFVTL